MATTPPAADKKKPDLKALPRERTFLNDDFPIIRSAVIVFVLSAIIGIGLIYSSQRLLEIQKQAVVAAHVIENKTREKLRSAQNELNEIYEFQPKYKQLVKDGFVGPEKRLEWVEAIQAVQKGAKLEPISYDIAEQQLFKVEPTMDIGTLELHGSKMTIKMNVLHEVDLLRFLNGIKGVQAYDLQNCAMQRVANPEINKLAPALSAECTLYWVTIGNPVSQEGDNGTGNKTPPDSAVK